MKEKTPLLNERIRAESLQLINEDGTNIGIVSREEALGLAHEAGADLVLIAERGKEGLPVAKIMDFGKDAYAKRKKQAIAKKKQKVIKIKEIKFRPKIGEHDFLTKLKQGVQFLKDGMRLKVTLVFRGREMAMRAERGTQLFDKINQTLIEFGLDNIVTEQDSKAGQFWSRVYYLK